MPWCMTAWARYTRSFCKRRRAQQAVHGAVTHNHAARQERHVSLAEVGKCTKGLSDNVAGSKAAHQWLDVCLALPFKKPCNWPGSRAPPQLSGARRLLELQPRWTSGGPPTVATSPVPSHHLLTGNRRQQASDRFAPALLGWRCDQG